MDGMNGIWKTILVYTLRIFLPACCSAECWGYITTYFYTTRQSDIWNMNMILFDHITPPNRETHKQCIGNWNIIKIAYYKL